MRSKTLVFLITGILLSLAFSSAHAKTDELTMHSQVASIDLGQSTFTTQGKHHGSMTFSLAPKATFVENGQLVSFSTLKVGDVVEVHYKDDGGTLQALNVEIQGTPRPPHGHHGHSAGSL